MTVTGLLCVMTTLWIFTIVSFLMSVRAASYLLKLKRQLDLNFVGERTHDSRGLEIGGPAPDFPIDSVAGDRARCPRCGHPAALCCCSCHRVANTVGCC